MIRKVIASTLLAIAIPFFAVSKSYAATDSKDVALVSAQKLVEEYKTLRSSCSKAVGEERVACFRQLSESNDAYTAAKNLLKQAQSAKSDDEIHLVTFL